MTVHWPSQSGALAGDTLPSLWPSHWIGQSLFQSPSLSTFEQSQLYKNFKLIEQIGHGVAGSVFITECTSTYTSDLLAGKKFAIKIVSRCGSYAVSELECLRSLSEGSHVVRLFDVFFGYQGAAFVLELLDTSLKVFMQGPAVHVEQASLFGSTSWVLTQRWADKGS